MGVFAYYGIYLAILMLYDSSCKSWAHGTCRQRIRCELAWSPDLNTWRHFPPNSSHTLSSEHLPVAASDSGYEVISPLPDGTPYSYDCVAAKPVEVPGEGIRIYFMEGDGPHVLHRKTKFDMGRLRADGFAGVRAADGEMGKLVT